MAKSKAAGKGKKAAPAAPEAQAAEKTEAFTHKSGTADTRGDTPGQPAGAHLDAPSAGVKS